MPLPAFALKAALGESASVLLTGQRALPAKAEALGFRFAHATIDDALADIAGGRGTPVDIRAVERP
jgi:NAD dependent epimerase/dehydratase family enzyme